MGRLRWDSDGAMEVPQRAVGTTQGKPENLKLGKQKAEIGQTGNYGDLPSSMALAHRDNWPASPPKLPWGERGMRIADCGIAGEGRTKPPQATCKPSAWEGVATHKPPPCDLQATPKPPRSESRKQNALHFYFLFSNFCFCPRAGSAPVDSQESRSLASERLVSPDCSQADGPDYLLSRALGRGAPGS